MEAPNAKATLSTEPYKGVRDFYPEDMRVEKHILNTMRSVAERFGYIEYNASILEPTALYRSKTSDEIVNEQTYTFTDRGGRDVTLRPEMTPTVARMIAGKRREITFPARWFSIPNVFRYEQPQRGRLREHWQLNVDMFGSASNEADIEIIAVAYHIMKAFWSKDEDFVIKINNRNAIRSALAAKLTTDQTKVFLSLVDKARKIGEEKFHEEIKKTFGEDMDFNITTPDTESQAIIDTLKARGITNVEFDPYIVRGFDYYTGMVFEVFDTNSENKRSLFGGGRYDNLTANFGGEAIPGVGFGMGDVTIRDFLETRGLIPPYASTTHLFIATTGDVTSGAQTLAENLRREGINVEVNITTKKVGDQIKAADKQSIPFVVVVGENELTKNVYTVKELSSGTETSCTNVQEITAVIRNK